MEEVERALRDEERWRRRAEREKERRRRRAERDAYYLDQGVKPGLLAWYRALPDWLQAIVLGLSLVMPVALVFAALYFLLR